MTDRSQVIELGGFSAAPECLQARGHGDVGPLPADLWPIRGIQPLPADFSQGVGPALAGSPPILPIPRPDLAVRAAAQGGEHGLPAVGIQVPVDANHPEHRRRDVQPAPCPQGILSGGIVPPRFHPVAPVGHHPGQVPDGVAHRRFHQHLLGLAERVMVGLPG